MEVNTAVLETSSGLHLTFIAELSCSGNHGAVNEPLVGGVVDLSECVVVSARDGEDWGQANTSEAEEVCHVHES